MPRILPRPGHPLSRRLLAAVAPLALALAPSVAEAEEVRIETASGVTHVVVDGKVVGPTPLVLTLPPGVHELTFRAAPLGSDLFSQRVQVPETRVYVIQVDLATQMIRSRTLEPGAMDPAPTVTAPSAAPAAAAPPSPPAPTATASSTSGADLYVQSTPAGARVLLDGVDTGQVTPTLLKGVNAGTRLVTLRNECGKAEAKVNFRNGLIERLDLALVEGTGGLRIESTPPKGLVFLDGTQVGITPLKVENVSCGEHRVDVRLAGHLQQSEVLRIPAYELTAVNVELPRETFGTLVLEPTPLTVDFTVDGVAVGSGPMTLEHVGTGPHAVQATEDGYDAWSGNIEIQADQVTRVPVVLTEIRPFPWGRVVLDAGVTAVGLGVSGLAVVQGLAALDAHQRWSDTDNDADANVIFEEEYAPLRNQALIEGAVGVAALVTSGVLWGTTRFTVGGPGFVGVSGTW